MKQIYFSICFAAIALVGTKPVQAQPNPAIEALVSGFTRPVKVTHANDTRLFVAEIGGKIRIVNNGGILPQPFLDISSKINDPDWAGIFSIAFAPDYQSSGKFYVLYVLKNSTEVQLSEFKCSTSNIDMADANSEVKILTIPYENVLGGHRGGDLAFGKDGYLYISTGDNGPGSRGDIGDPNNNSQNMGKLFGKILRLNMSDALPADNILTKIFALGLRNPWRFSFDRSTGDLWIGDNGQDAWEEVNYLQYPFAASASNFGWNCLEANQTYTASHCAPGTTYTPPKYNYPGFNNNGGNSASVMGGYVYRGSKYPSMKGYYFFGDYQSGKIGLVSPAGTGSLLAGPSYPSLISFSEDQDGELYVLSFLNGTLSKITNPDDPLPVELAYLKFSRADIGFVLEWKTFFERNFKEFDLQRSSDGKRFETIATIPAAGAENTYHYQDNQAVSGDHFYRLKIIDMDDSYHYSKVVIAKVDDAGNDIVVFPNPALALFKVKGLRKGYDITLHNAFGKTIWSKKALSQNELEISLRDQPDGIYTLRIVDHASGFSESRKLVKE